MSVVSKLPNRTSPIPSHSVLLPKMELEPGVQLGGVSWEVPSVLSASPSEIPPGDGGVCPAIPSSYQQKHFVTLTPIC